MLVESSVSDLLRSTFRVALYAMLAGIEVVVGYVEGWCRGLTMRGSGTMVVSRRQWWLPRVAEARRVV
jgi:hypothetical protein